MGMTPIMVCERRVAEELSHGTSAGMGDEIKRIAKLKDHAIETPKSRKAIVKALEEYMQKRKGTKEGRAAQKAISMIITVAMLEVLRGEDGD